MAEEDRRYAGPEEIRLTTDTTREVLDYVVQELRRIGYALSPGLAADFLKLRTLHAEPAKPREGMVVSADGTDWDPGSGAGLYQYVGGVWVACFGGGGGGGGYSFAEIMTWGLGS